MADATRLRTRCCIPFCPRSTRADEPGEEWLCPVHLRPLPRALRVEYAAAWHEAEKADRRLADGLDVSAAPFERVCAAWAKLKAAALERFAGAAGAQP